MGRARGPTAGASSAGGAPARAWIAITPWPGAGTNTLAVSAPPASWRGRAARSPAAASTSTSTSPAARLRQPRVDVPAQLARPRGPAAPPAAARGAAARSSPPARPRARGPARLADEHVERVRARGVAAITVPSAQLARHVLGRVHGEVDLAGQQRGLQRADPARLVAARAVDVARGGDLHELGVGRRAARATAPRLRERQRAAARAEPQRGQRVRSGRTSAAPLARRLRAPALVEPEQLAQQRQPRVALLGVEAPSPAASARAAAA